jgi:hypothetical protein
MQLAHYLGLLERAQRNLAAAFREVGGHHDAEHDVAQMCTVLSEQCTKHAEQLAAMVDRYGHEQDDEPDRLHHELFEGTRSGGLGLLRDLHDLYLMACECDITWTLIGQAAQGLRDHDLVDLVHRCETETSQQKAWIAGRMKQAAPQALVVAP